MKNEFDKCVKDGGLIKSKSLTGKPPFLRVCYPKFGSPAIQEEIKMGAIKIKKGKK